MKILRLFHKKAKEEKKEKLVEKKQPTELEVICGGRDTKVYKALCNTLLLRPPNPKNEDSSIEGELEKARQKEEAKDISGAAQHLFQAGRLALFKGDVEGMKKYFGQYKEITGRNLLILEIPEEAVEKAREYYKSIETHKIA